MSGPLGLGKRGSGEQAGDPQWGPGEKRWQPCLRRWELRWKKRKYLINFWNYFYATPST